MVNYPLLLPLMCLIAKSADGGCAGTQLGLRRVNFRALGFEPSHLKRVVGAGLCSPPPAAQALSLPLAASLCLDVIPVIPETPRQGLGPWGVQQDSWESLWSWGGSQAPSPPRVGEMVPWQ